MKIPKMTIGEEIRHKIEDGFTEELPRPYIGYSSLGQPCMRNGWYAFRWCRKQKVNNRIQRLFNRGKYEERIIIKDLATVGISISKRQFEVKGLAGHVLGHIDGILSNVPFFDYDILGEFKTANLKYFKEIIKRGCKIAKIDHYIQAQCYMGKMEVDDCLYVVTCKDDEYRHIETINFDKAEFNTAESKSYAILESDAPLQRIGGPTWYECKFCESRQICHFNAPILITCRSCIYGTIEDNGKWTCNGKRELSLKDQENACENYEILPSLLT